MCALVDIFVLLQLGFNCFVLSPLFQQGLVRRSSKTAHLSPQQAVTLTSNQVAENNARPSNYVESCNEFRITIRTWQDSGYTQPQLEFMGRSQASGEWALTYSLARTNQLCSYHLYSTAFIKQYALAYR